MFKTKVSYVPTKGDVQSEESKTEQAGYISPKVQVERLLLAGRMLGEYRKELYDFGPEDEEDEEFSDPTRAPNYDLADASQSMIELAKKKKRPEVLKPKPEPVPETETPKIIPPGTESHVVANPQK